MKKIFTILFFALLGLNNTNAATFSSVASGTWSAPATWTVTGTDADGIPDVDDDVTINNGHTVIMTVVNNFAKSITISNGGTLDWNNNIIYLYGNLTVNGNSVGNIFHFRVQAPCVLTSTPTFTNNGIWIVYSNLTIAPGTVIDKNSGSTTLYNSGSVSNFGTVNMRGQTSVLSTSSLTSWTNQTNSSLLVTFPLSTSTAFNFSAANNTVTIHSQCTSIPSTTYYNLTLSNINTKTALGDIIVLNNLTRDFIAAGSNNLNMNNFNLTIGGNYTNNANNVISNSANVTFNGTSTQTISKTTASETFKNLIIAASSSVTLNQSISVTQDLTLNAGASLDVSASNYSVVVKGNLINNGSINSRSGIFIFNGTTAQTISGTGDAQFYNLQLNNSAGLTVNSAQSLKNLLTVTAGNFNSNSNFTLISDGTRTGCIGPVGGSLSGSMTIQKHISARAANYHDLSSPVSSTTIMDWDDDLYMSGIGADDGTPGPAGVDGGAGGDSTVYIWNETTASYNAVTGASTSLAVGKGYEIFIADDLTSWAARTIDTKGVPNFGTKTINLSYSAGAGSYAGLNLIGNPYAASVNYASCSKILITGNPLILDNSGNYTDYGASPVIPPLQGFWVTASSAGGAKLSFTEVSKSTNTATNFYRTKPNYGIKLVFSSSMLPFYNENTINFESDANLGYDKELDALYLKSPNKTAPAMYMLTNSDAKLITNTIDSEEDEVSIPLALYTPKQGVYQIEPSVLNTSNYNYAWIENAVTGKIYELNSTISIYGEEDFTNTNYVLHLSKKSIQSNVNQSIFDNDLVVFGTENYINLKSINTTHYNSRVNVYDISGKLLIEENNITIETGSSVKIDISNLSTGVYIVNVTDSLGHVKTQKIIR